MDTDLGTLGLEVEITGYEQVMESLDHLRAKSEQVMSGFKSQMSSGFSSGVSRNTGAAALGQLTKTGKDTSSLIGDALGRSFDQFISRGGDAKDMLKSLEKEALALGSSLLTGKRTTSSGDLFSGLFSGASDLLSTAFGGFASGGSFRVGGAAGRDRNLVGLRLSRGEEVTVQTPGQQRDNSGAAAMPANVTFNYQISTPDVAGFRRSQSQLQSEAFKSASRLLKRNG